jgi:regulator of sirC expression with transglutaminase-like and TPR domain
LAITETNFAGLLRLLDEDDAARLDGLLDQLSRLPAGEFAELQARAAGASPRARTNLGFAAQRAVYARLEPAWRELAARRTPSLEEGLILIARTDDDDAGRYIVETIDALAAQAAGRLSGDRAFDLGLEALGECLRKHGLRGNEADYYAPANSYLHRVLKTGRGIPLSLCCVAILCGQRMDLPIQGVGLPGHFLGFYGDAELGFGTWFDPFDGFKKKTAAEVAVLAARYVPGGLDLRQLRPATEREILARTLRNLVRACAVPGSEQRVKCLGRWLEHLKA